MCARARVATWVCARARGDFWAQAGERGRDMHEQLAGQRGGCFRPGGLRAGLISSTADETANALAMATWARSQRRRLIQEGAGRRQARSERADIRWRAGHPAGRICRREPESMRSGLSTSWYDHALDVDTLEPMRGSGPRWPAPPHRVAGRASDGSELLGVDGSELLGVDGSELLGAVDTAVTVGAAGAAGGEEAAECSAGPSADWPGPARVGSRRARPCPGRPRTRCASGRRLQSRVASFLRPARLNPSTPHGRSCSGTGLAWSIEGGIRMLLLLCIPRLSLQSLLTQAIRQSLDPFTKITSHKSG